MSQLKCGSALRAGPATRGWEILDARRLRRGRRIEWRVSTRVHAQFRDLLGELVALEQEPQNGEVIARMEALREDIRALPGYPTKYDPDRDLIVPVTTSVTR